MARQGAGKGAIVARVPITVYLTLAELAQIEARASALGKSRSAWVSDTLLRALGGELQRYDEVHLEQLCKVRAGQEVLLEALAELDRTRIAVWRERVLRYGERLLQEARERIGR